MTCAMRWATSLVGLAMMTALAGCPDDGPTPQADDSTGPDSSTTAGMTMTSMSTVTDTSSDGSIDTWSEPSTGDSGTADSGTATETSAGTDSGTSGTTGDTSDGTTGDTTGGVVGGACESDADCVLVDDCCSCTALHVDDDPAPCGKDCKASVCEVSGIPMHPVECRFGTCQLADVDCNQDLVQCDVPPPDCPEGQLPSVGDGCWTNDCVPAQACNTVPDCSWCAPGETCVGTATQLGLFSSCEPVDPSCDGMPSCACMGEVCTNPFMCGESPGEDPLGCFCPVCG